MDGGFGGSGEMSQPGYGYSGGGFYGAQGAQGGFAQPGGGGIGMMMPHNPNETGMQMEKPMQVAGNTPGTLANFKTTQPANQPPAYAGGLSSFLASSSPAPTSSVLPAKTDVYGMPVKSLY
jgi:hypothetical protein